MTPHFLTSHPRFVVTSAARASTLLAHHETARCVGSILSIADPGPKGKRPHARFFHAKAPNTLRLDFDDAEVIVPILGDGAPFALPSQEHVLQIIGFGTRPAVAAGRLLVHCFAGRSRSTSAAFIILCARLGPGREPEAMTQLLTACERAPLPNMLMVRLADEVLGRGGAMVHAAQAQNDDPCDAECEQGRPVTGTALLAACRRGAL